MNLNQATLIGRVTRDPEIKALPAGTSVAQFSLATNHVYKNSEGKKIEDVDFHNIVAFGKVVDSVIAQYVKKGQLICVQGRIRTRSWEDKKSGEKKYRTEIVLDTLQLGPRAAGEGSHAKPSDDEGGGMTTKEFDEYGNEPEEKKVPRKKGNDAGDDISPDEIPF